MKTIRAAGLGWVVLSLLAGCSPPAAPSPPNLLFILADDQRADTLAAWGNPVIQTPNLDRLVEEGFSFRQAYCMGSLQGAVCVPSRAMILSGRSLFRVQDDLSGVKTLPELLREAGYTTFGTGKWHNQPASFLRGFSQGKAVFFGGMSDHTQVPVVDTTADGRRIDERVGEKFSSTLFADAAVEFLREYDGRAPFFAYVAFTAPHDPRQAPPGYIDLYPPEAVPLPPNFLPQHPFFNGWMTGRDEVLAPWPRLPQVIRHQLAEYYGMITHLDAQVGRLLEVLRETGRDRDTVIVYAADHGLALGSHGLLGKQNLYEHSMRAPLVFRGPGIPSGSSDALVYLLDLFPTLCQLAGLRLPDGVEGESLVPLWRGEKEEVRSSLFTAYEQFMRAVRDRRWKLIRYPHINRSQLFDLQNDPHELHDLAGDPEHEQTLGRLMSLLVQWQERLGDPQPLSSENPQPAEIDLTGHPREPDRHQPEWIVRKYFRMEGWESE